MFVFLDCDVCVGGLKLLSFFYLQLQHSVRLNYADYLAENSYTKNTLSLWQDYSFCCGIRDLLFVSWLSSPFPRYNQGIQEGFKKRTLRECDGCQLNKKTSVWACQSPTSMPELVWTRFMCIVWKSNKMCNTDMPLRVLTTQRGIAQITHYICATTRRILASLLSSHSLSVNLLFLTQFSVLREIIGRHGNGFGYGKVQYTTNVYDTYMHKIQTGICHCDL